MYLFRNIIIDTSSVGDIISGSHGTYGVMFTSGVTNTPRVQLTVPVVEIRLP